MGDSQAPTTDGAYASRRTAPAPFSGVWHKLVTYWVLARFPFRFYFGALGALFVMVFGRVVYNAPLYNIPVIL
ncbi:MAG: hypothetical protein ACXV5F_10305, partial [Halobacteriota archaeon]